ncbi:hypothetical protein BO94DRAFT_530081 [Aspergillus sclerotioniger CBS 115572]|uniref:Arrestin-like N-terminal domain-containing protein n=1 Tax=Aspergillus sclerotioniger CBS 115572 TaxID=1450535 RepID=A0A317XDT1_9EURO|nr:hypothetical protein BO94DRAFT_530081 [Aspergillus sclerotioniger CBS 115572]PWY96704.1 hypothetical protein BO94DRAFT_530081 [Aspergillus sclerotioniger CBS 115572]
MPLTVCVNDQQPCYSGNETIRGRITFETSKPIDIQDVRVTFSGCAKAKVQKVKGSAAPTTSYRSKCMLFEKDAILWHPNGETVVPGTYEWPFEFVFPSQVLGSSKWPETLPFRSDANHPLPPTFAAETADVLRKLTCNIDYQIQAQVFSPQRGFLGKKPPLFSEVVRLNFMPFSARLDMKRNNNSSALYQQQKEQVFNLRSMLLLPENRGRSLKLQEKIQSWLSSSQLPRFSFKASFTCAYRVIQSTPLPCFLEITPLLEDSSVTSPPEILMQSLSITVLSQTAARAAPSLMGALSGQVDERIEILSKTSLGMPVSGTVDLAQVFGPLIFRHTEVSFGTFNISRTYRLCATFVFECAGNMRTFDVTDIPITIFADFGEPDKIQSSVEHSPPSYTSGSILSTETLEES